MQHGDLWGKDLDENGVVAVVQPVMIHLIDSRSTDAVDQSNQSRLGEWSWENNGFEFQKAVTGMVTEGLFGGKPVVALGRVPSKKKLPRPRFLVDGAIEQ